MNAAAAQLPIEISSFLSRFERRRRGLRALRAGGRALLFAMIWTVIWCLLDRVIELPGAVRAIGLIAGISIACTILARPLLALVASIDLGQVALEVERRDRRFVQRLATITSRSTGPLAYRGSPGLLAALSARVCDQIHRRGPARLLRARPALRPWIACTVVVMIVVPTTRSAWLDAPVLLRRWAMPMGDLGAVTTTRLIVQPGDIAIPRGDPLRIQVHASHLPADQPPPILHVRSIGGTWTAQMTSPLPNGSFEARIAPVMRDLEYFVTGGDATSDVSRVQTLPHPAIESFEMDIAYPAYTMLPPARFDNADGTITAPVGAQVTLTIHCTQPLRLASMAIGAESVRMTSAGGAAQWQARFSVQHDAAYTIRMAGLKGAGSAYRGGMLRAIPDRPPIASIRSSGQLAGGDDSAAGGSDGPATIPADSTLPVFCQASDDYPLARVDIEVTIRRDATARHQTFSLPARGQRQILDSYPLSLGALGARPGDLIEARLRVEDSAGQFDLSAPLEWSVVPARGMAQPPAGTRPAEQAPVGRPPAPFDPEGYDGALNAYFQVLRGGSATDK